MTYRQIQRLYSNAFDDGFEFFAQKEFGLGIGSWIKEKLGIVTEKDLEDVKSKAEEEQEKLEKKLKDSRTMREKIIEGKNKIIKEQEEAAKQAKAKQEGFEKSLKRWKIGAGVTAGVAGLGGLGAYLYNRKKNKD